MSGGHYDYLSLKVGEFAESIECKNDPKRIAFVELVKLVGEACKAIEWEDSGDTCKDNTDEAIIKAFEFLKADANTIVKARSYDKLKETFEDFLSGERFP